MTRPKILIQLDPDPLASVFDAVVAIDSGVEHLLQYGGVRPDDVRGLVHGAIFTRGPQDLHRTAVFVGGSDVAAGEELLERVRAAFFGPLRVSVMLDANGANTTAAAAVLAAAEHQSLPDCTALVLAGTGPVGQRAARMLVRQGARVRLASRRADRAAAVCQRLAEQVAGAELEPLEANSPESTARALQGVAVVIAAGAAGVELLSAEVLRGCDSVRVAVDLNAVPPAGIAGVDAGDRGVTRQGVICYGALGVGAAKMQIHRAAIGRLFQRRDQILDADEIYDLGRDLLRQTSPLGDSGQGG